MSDTASGRKEGWTRYHCRKCNRPLSFDARYRDTVSAKPAADPVRFVHDGCGGIVNLSRRAAR